MLLLLAACAIQPARAGDLDGFLEKILLGDQSQAGQTQRGQLGGNRYRFSPGEAIVNTADYRIYYSGFEETAQGRVLLLTLVTNQSPVILKYPNPDIIHVRDIRLRVHAFDNRELEVERLRQTLQGP